MVVVVVAVAAVVVVAVAVVVVVEVAVVVVVVMVTVERSGATPTIKIIPKNDAPPLWLCYSYRPFCTG